MVLSAPSAYLLQSNHPGHLHHNLGFLLQQLQLQTLHVIGRFNHLPDSHHHLIIISFSYYPLSVGVEEEEEEGRAGGGDYIMVPA